MQIQIKITVKREIKERVISNKKERKWRISKCVREEISIENECEEEDTDGE